MRRGGLLDRLLYRLQARLNAAGLIDADLWCMDFPTNGGRWVNGLSGSFVLGR